MELKIKETIGGEFAKKGEDISNGDVVKIKDDGRSIEGQYGPQTVFSIETKNGDKIATFNQTSLNAIIAEFGGLTEKWIGKSLTVIAIKQSVGGKFLDVYYFVPEGYEMGERGFVKNEELPTINIDDDDSEKVPDLSRPEAKSSGESKPF